MCINTICCSNMPISNQINWLIFQPKLHLFQSTASVPIHCICLYNWVGVIKAQARLRICMAMWSTHIPKMLCAGGQHWNKSGHILAIFEESSVCLCCWLDVSQRIVVQKLTLYDLRHKKTTNLTADRQFTFWSRFTVNNNNQERCACKEASVGDIFYWLLHTDWLLW